MKRQVCRSRMEREIRGELDVEREMCLELKV